MVASDPCYTAEFEVQPDGGAAVATSSLVSFLIFFSIAPSNKLQLIRLYDSDSDPKTLLRISLLILILEFCLILESSRFSKKIGSSNFEPAVGMCR
jgi:hypothetical protein